MDHPAGQPAATHRRDLLWPAEAPHRPVSRQHHAWQDRHSHSPGVAGNPARQRRGRVRGSQGVPVPAGRAHDRRRRLDHPAEPVPDPGSRGRKTRRTPGAHGRSGLQLIELLPERARALVLLATFVSLRWGEVVALRRSDLDLESATASVRLQQVELDTGKLLIGPPKSRAGVRTVAYPAAITPMLRDHVDKFVGPEPDALIFTGPRGGTWRRSNFRRYTRWHETVRRSAYQGCISTIFAIPAITGRPAPERACGT